MTIAPIEAALVDFIDDCLPDEIDVAAAPGDWDDSYIRSLLTALPAVRVVFDGGVQGPETFVTMESRWVIFCAVGWKGETEASRRLGSEGAYSLLDVLVPALHGSKPRDPNGKTLTSVQVETVENLWTAALEKASMAVYAIGISCDMEFDIDPADAKGRLDDFLKAGVEFELPDDPAADLPDGDFDLPR